MITRTCTMCGQSFPATHQYFAWAIKHRRKLQARCRTCAVAAYKRKQRPPQDVLNYAPEPKTRIVREKTDHGTTIVRFGEGWRANGAIVRQSSWAGYASGFEK